MARRVQTENCQDFQAQYYDINELSDENENFMLQEADDESDYNQEIDDNQDGEAEDLINYKGIYFNDDQGQKFQDPETGAHFEFSDMHSRLSKILKERISMGLQTKEEDNLEKVKVLSFQKEKEEFMKKLGYQKKEQQVLQQKQEQIFEVKKEDKVQNQVTSKTFVETKDSQMKENNKNLLKQMLVQQPEMLIKQIQQQKQHQLSQQKQQNRCKSNQKQTILTQSQKCKKQSQSNIQDMINQSQNLGIKGVSKFQQQHNENRGKTPENQNKLKTKIQNNIISTEQNIQRLKQSLGYNESTITSVTQNKTQAINKNKTSQKSNRDNSNQIKNSLQSKQITNHSRNGKGSSATQTFYKNLANKSQTINKQQNIYTNNYTNDMVETMIKNNANTYAFKQNLIQKSRNTGNIKQATSIGANQRTNIPTTNNINNYYFDNYQQRKKSGNKYSNANVMTNNSLYSMIYQNRKGGFINNYLNGFEQNSKSFIGQNQGNIQGKQIHQKVRASRNQELVAPAGTRKQNKNTYQIEQITAKYY